MSCKNSLILAFGKLLLSVATVFIFCISASAQVYSPYVKDLKAQAIDGKIYMSWTTRAGFTCTDIHIAVSRDSTAGFQRKGTYFGVCGDTSEKDYTYVLENPHHNALNYLKLELGNYGYSYVISELVIYVQNEVLVLPHPAIASSILHFQNRSNSEVGILLYASDGTLLKSIKTIGKSIHLSDFNLPVGFVVYEIRRENTAAVRGKFLVASIY
jgi:hypothetical protein